jgi:hypothetical protein
MSGSIKIGLGNLGGDIAQGQDRVLASPYEGFSSLVIASARGKQLELEDAEDPDLERFIGAYRHGPKSPEPGAACTSAAEEQA